MSDRMLNHNEPFFLGSMWNRIKTPTLTPVKWLERELPDPRDQRAYAQERSIVAITEAIGEAMEKAGLNQSDVAERLERTKGYVSQLLTGKRNMTLRTLGELLWACDVEIVDLQLAPLGVAYVSDDHAMEWHKEVTNKQPSLDTTAEVKFEFLTPSDASYDVESSLRDTLKDYASAGAHYESSTLCEPVTLDDIPKGNANLARAA